MASVHKQALSNNYRIVFHVPKSGPWFRSSGFDNEWLATILANVLEFEANIAAEYGMNEDSTNQLEKILNDLFEYFNGRKRPRSKLEDFVSESVTVWTGAANSRSSIDCFKLYKKNFLKWAKPKACWVTEFTFAFINEYFLFLNASHYARNSVIQQRSFVKRLAKRAKELKLLREDPLAGTFVKCKQKAPSNKKEHGITNDELEKVYGYLDDEIKKEKVKYEKIK